MSHIVAKFVAALRQGSWCDPAMTTEVIALFLFCAALTALAVVVKRAQSRILSLERHLADKDAELSSTFKRTNKLALDRMIANERERIMREMHDGMGGTLVSTLALVESGDFDQASLSEAIRAALDDMRLVIDSLDPDVDDVPTLLAMVRCRLEPRLKRRGMRFVWKVDDLPELEGMGPEQYLHILRIVQESITNVIKHAEADTITVTTRADEDNAYIEVQDDGRGLSEGAIVGGRGLGNMRFRADELGGAITVENMDEGTGVMLRIPITPDDASTRSLRLQTITDLGR